MIKKYIENTEEIQQRLTEMLMEDAREMCRYQRDIYMYIDDNGRASLEWYINVCGNSWLDDDHILLHRCKEHYEGIEDSIDGTAMLAEIINMTEAELVDRVCKDQEIDRDDLQYADCISWALWVYEDTIRAWYDECIEDARTDYEDQADEILRDFCCRSTDDALAADESLGEYAQIVWLFEI